MPVRLIPLALLALGVACSTDPPAKDVPGDGTGDSDTDTDTMVEPGGPTWHGGVGHVVVENCGSCHQAGGLAGGLDFTQAELASSLSGAIAAATASRAMPPFLAESGQECPNPWGWLHDPRLAPDEIALLEDWYEAGAPLGEPDATDPVPSPPQASLPGAGALILPPGGFTVEPIGAVQDDFICYSLDPGLTDESWMEAFQVMPSNQKVAHHVLVGIDPTGASAALTDDDGVYPCFGGFGEVPGAEFIGGWVPGAAPTAFPEHSALRVPAGARIVLQMHYHRADSEEFDQTGVAVRWSESPPVMEARVELIGNATRTNDDGSGLQAGVNDPDSGPAFFIPAGATEHEETMYTSIFDYRFRERQVFLIANHMHYIGTDMRVWVEPGDNAPEDAEDSCLLHTPAWDFNWQLFYAYDVEASASPVIHPGDDFWLKCAYDNSLENPGVVKVLAESGLTEPVDIALGEGSLDEMCIAILGTVPRVETRVEDATHAGTATMHIEAAGFGIDAPCSGPMELADDGSGSTTAAAACGLDLGGTLYTAELLLSGPPTVNGGAVLQILDVPGDLSGEWSGEPSSPTFRLTGEIAGEIFTVTGSLESD